MATVRNNSVTQGLSGMLGNQIVFRQLRNKTIVAKRPKPARRQSNLQRANRKRFQHASAFAKAAMYDPQKKSYYWEKARELGLPNAYTAAITEYMRRTSAKSSDQRASGPAPTSGQTTTTTIPGCKLSFGARTQDQERKNHSSPYSLLLAPGFFFYGTWTTSSAF